jgi:G3E family GTPase
MQILVLSGFLGSGKTTLLLKLLEELVEKRGKKVAVIENEIGKIGVDGAVVENNNLPVREIYSGCICCSLQVDLLTSLALLEKEYDPEIVILEPSGVAGASGVVGALEIYDGRIDSIYMVMILDAPRLKKIREQHSVALLTHGIDVADLLLMNKIDLLSDEEVASLKKTVYAIRDDVVIHPVSIRDGIGLDKMISQIADGASSTAQTKEREAPKEAWKAVLDHDGDKIAPTIHAAEFRVEEDKIANQLAGSLENLVTRIKEEGCLLIGHIKAILKNEKGQFQRFSVTSFEEPMFQEGLEIPKGKSTFTINIIIYGVPKTKVEEIVKDCFPFQ